MQNLLEIQNALRSAPDQQLMALMQGANPAVPQWAVASELNNRREMRMEQTRQQGLGQPTVLAQLTGAASAPTPQTNVAGMPQGVASGMAQSMAPRTNVNQNTGINTVARNANAAAPVATMASGGILKMQDGGDPAEKTYTFVYPEDMNTPPFKSYPGDGIFEEMVKTFRRMGGTIKETDTGRVMRSDTAKKIIQESKIPLLEDVIKQINDGKIITQTDLKAADGSIISKTTPALTGLEEYEASLPISEDMQRKLDVLTAMRRGEGAADIANSLGMKMIDVIDIGMGIAGNGTLRAGAFANDLAAWAAGAVLGDAPSAEALAKNSTKLRTFADGLFYKDGDKVPKFSEAINNSLNITSDEDAAAAELAAYQTALNTKINAMPESSAVFAEGSPTQYTPAGIAVLNREYGPADEDMSKMTKQIQGVYDAEQAVKDKARFSGSPYRQGVGNINEYVSGVAALDAANRRYYPEAQGVSSLPSNFPVVSPTPAPPQATIAADMATNVEGADTYDEGIATAINNVQREVPSKEAAAQTDANSEASLDDKAAIDIDPMTLLPYNNPLAQNPKQGTSKYSPKGLYDTHLESVLRRRAESDARRAEKTRIAELEKSAAETRSVYGEVNEDGSYTPYTEIPDVPLTPETKGIIGDLAQKDKGKDKGLAAVNPMANRASDSPSSYEQKLLDILAEREKSADQDKWLGLAEMGMRLMASSNPNLLSAIGESGLGAFGSYRKQQAGQDAEELNILGKLADMDMAERTLQARIDIANAAASAKANKPPMNFSALGKYYEDRYDDALAAYLDVDPDTGPNAGNVSNDEVMRRRKAVLDAHKTVTGHYASEGLRGPTLPFAAANTIIKTGQ